MAVDRWRVPEAAVGGPLASVGGPLASANQFKQGCRWTVGKCRWTVEEFQTRMSVDRWQVPETAVGGPLASAVDRWRLLGKLAVDRWTIVPQPSKWENESVG